MIHNNIDPYRMCHKSNINQSNVYNLLNGIRVSNFDDALAMISRRRESEV